MKAIPDHMLRLKSDWEAHAFLNDTVDLFSRKRSGQMNPYAFNEPVPSIPDDPVRGGVYWERFVNSSQDYYLITEEADLIADYAAEMGAILPENLTCVDMGPGEKTAVLTKTIPFLTGLKTPSRYIPVDVNSAFVQNACHIVRTETGLETEGIVADFFENNLGLPPKTRKAMFLFGGLLCNLGKSKGISAEEELRCALARLRLQLNCDDYFIVTQDINQNGSNLMAAYSHSDLARYIMTVLHRIQRDLPVRGFDPLVFSFYSCWNDQENLVTLGARANKLLNFQIGNQAFSIRQGQEFPLVNCYKFPEQKFLSACRHANFSAQHTFRSSKGRIVLHVLKAV